MENFPGGKPRLFHWVREFSVTFKALLRNDKLFSLSICNHGSCPHSPSFIVIAGAGLQAIKGKDGDFIE